MPFVPKLKPSKSPIVDMPLLELPPLNQDID